MSFDADTTNSQAIHILIEVQLICRPLPQSHLTRALMIPSIMKAKRGGFYASSVLPQLLPRGYDLPSVGKPISPTFLCLSTLLI